MVLELALARRERHSQPQLVLADLVLAQPACGFALAILEAHAGA